MADLAKQVITVAGLDPAYAAAAVGGDKFVPDADTVLHVKNGSGGALTVQVATPRTDPGTGLAETDVSVSVPAGDDRFLGPFPAEVFADPLDVGKAAITYPGGVTSLTIACLVAPRR